MDQEQHPPPKMPLLKTILKNLTENQLYGTVIVDLLQNIVIKNKNTYRRPDEQFFKNC